MTSILSNLKKRFSIKPTTSDIVNNNDESEIKQLNINSNNNNSNNSELKKVYKRKKSTTVDSSEDDKSDQSNDEDDNENSGENLDQNNEKTKKSVSFKEQPKPNNIMANKQLSAVPKAKRKSIIIQPPTNMNQNNINTTTIRNDLDNKSLPPVQKKVPLTHLQISEIYANCIKLSTENKINQKNSWTLKLIDHFDDVLENQHAGEKNTTNFQAASCVLDASVKIYSNRVDSVHVDTYKILGGLSRAEREELNNDNDDDDDEGKDKENEENKNKNKKKKKKTGINTLEQNLDNITIKKFDLQFMVDPLFGKTSAAFDEGGAKGLLLNNLSIYGDCKLVFDSNDAIYSTTDNNGDNNDDEEKIESTPSSPSNIYSKINITPWKHLFEPGSNNSLEICPTYCGFSDWSVKSKDGLTFNLSSLLRKNPDEEKQQQQPQQNNQDNFLNHSGDDDFEIEQSNQPQAQHDEIDLNKIGNNLDDGDMGIHFGGGDDDFGDGIGMGYDEDDEDDNNNNRNNDHNIMGILDANQDWEQLNLIEPNQNQNWNGPEHWKFSKKKINKKDEENAEEGSESDKTKKKKKVTRKKAFLLDFDSAPPPESMFEPGKGSTLTAASLKKASETSTILPPDIHYDIKMLSRLFNKPKCSIPPMSKREEVLRFLNTKPKRNNDGDRGDNDDDDEDNGNQDFDFPNSQILQDDFNPNENMNGGRGIDDDDGYPGIGGWDDDGPLNQNQNNPTSNNNGNGGANINNNGGFAFGLNGGVLIDEPRKVNKIDINYARVSKKIDVRSLKTSVWSIIDSENDNQTTSTANSSKDIETDEHSFGSLIDDLKEEQNQLRLNNKPTAGEISIPLAFICVLHLANEKNLTLNQDNINNFIISK
ncbi:hypothetical protein RB653_005299 [Dictyostelium firmibasis]|uniref:Condensin complex subunit 2 n=1 Tax=Dictyostelium firmibasis TaxID=79012 RepID=A0AAN7YZ44_9MYCE